MSSTTSISCATSEDFLLLRFQPVVMRSVIFWQWPVALTGHLMLSLSTMSTPTSRIKVTAAGAELHCTRLRARSAISSGTQKDKGGLPQLHRALKHQWRIERR